MTDTTLDPGEHLHVGQTGFRLSPSPLTLDDPEGSKIKVKLFDVKFVENGNSYDGVPIGFTSDDLERLKVKVTNEAVTAIGMWGYTPVGLTGVIVCLLSTHADRHVVDISFTVCFLFVFLFVRRSFVTDISGVGRLRVMKFCRMAELGC